MQAARLTLSKQAVALFSGATLSADRFRKAALLRRAQPVRLHYQESSRSTRTLASMTTPGGTKAVDFEAQSQEAQPGREHEMDPKPEHRPPNYKPAGKLEGKIALITGGDSGIGRAVAHLYALEECAGVAIVYVPGPEDKDAEDTVEIVEKAGKGKTKCIKIATDLGFDENCKEVVDEVVKTFGRIDILVNNAAEQHYVERLEDLKPEQVERVFRTNIFSQFFLTRYALPHMKEGSAIINTTSINAYKGNKALLDYTATKGAIVAFTRGLALQLVERGIRVNGVAPGPIWTPLIPASAKPEKQESFGHQVPMDRAGHPGEVATAYVFLGSDDSSYYTGQVLHPNGGVVINT